MKKTTFTRKSKKSVRIAPSDTDNDIDKNDNKSKNKNIKSERSLPGTRISVVSGQINISTGHSFIDSAFGGGIGLGQIALIKEDINSTYYRVLLSLNIAQGLCLPESQDCLVISHNSFLPLPKPLQFKGSTYTENEKIKEKEKMKIAWRYDDNIKEKIDPSGNRRAPFSNVFDLHKQMELSEERKNHLITLDLTSLRRNNPSIINSSQYSSINFFNNLLKTIETHVKRCNEEKRVLRIILHSFGSPNWLDCRNNIIDKEIIRFLHKLKGLIRNSTSVCFISFPGHLFSNSIISKVQRICDINCNFKSFKGQTDEDIDEAYKDYQGFFNITKLPRINALTRHLADTPSYVFSRKRHKLLVEVFALPPELSRTTESNQSQQATKLLCQPGPPKDSELDF